MIEQFLIEDIRDGDLTSEAIFAPSDQATGQFIAKEAGIIAGLDIIQSTYELLDPTVEVQLQKQDGDSVEQNTTIAHVTGPTRTLLTGERVILNLIQRLSGIASLTHKAKTSLNDETIQICDTRKTTPGLRMLEKYAVRVGGGKNHRFGLYDGVMIKDNHIAFCGSITNAVERVRATNGHMVKIEVETETETQVREAVSAGADIIMFDNQEPDTITQLGALVPKHIITEASGGITLETIGSFTGCGVDYISLGFLTHSVQSLDISFVAQIKN